MWLFKTWTGLFGKGRAQKPIPELKQGPWGQTWQRVQEVSEGFGRVAELTKQYRDAIFQGFDKVIVLTHQYRDGASTLERNLTALYERSCTTEEHYQTLLQKLAGLVDYCEQLSTDNKVLGPVRDQVCELLAAHGVKPYLPEEGKPVDLKLCVIEVLVPSETKPPGLVVKVISKGYLWGNVTLVPAKVAATADPIPGAQPDKTLRVEHEALSPEEHERGESIAIETIPEPKTGAKNQTLEKNPNKDKRS
jgi:molecular chaperone GrpE (heat shock protein)